MNYDEILKELQSAIDQDQDQDPIDNTVQKLNQTPDQKLEIKKNKSTDKIFLSNREKVRLLEDINKVIAYLKPIVNSLNC